ncbi:iron(III) transport system substrate-binding protein [Propionispira arboris]|uniref:Iron(III) transport system substrate-binding protein n=1 Tax=Propionispira arboris TaxID=84035 RepID=A0A1H6V2S8_9FIRM|nr:ABC transporter substrate-binding protein [Propionispira arboris]SEI98196.1 iron(III) transport system substrate-binding protein [Propionispira arboris]
MGFLKKRVWAGLLTFFTVAVLLTGCSSQNASETSPDKLSGSITVYTSQPEEDIQKLIEKFNEEQPDIKVNVFRSGTEEVVSKVLAEKETGNVQADVLLVADAATFEELKGKDLLMSYQSPELKGISKEYYDADYTYTGTKIISTGIIYNKNIIKIAPTSYKDLTKAEFENNVIMPSPLYSGAAAYNLSVLTRTNGIGWEYYQLLKDKGAKVDKGNGTVQKAVIDGRVGSGIIVDYMALRSKKKGAPVEFVYPSEGSLTITEPVGILKATTHVELAKAFVDFILSEAGQKVTAEIGYTPIKSGVKAPEGFKSVDEIKNITYDLATLVKARQDDKEKFSRIFN